LRDAPKCLLGNNEIRLQNFSLEFCGER
jgi:hypothetical protein